VVVLPVLRHENPPNPLTPLIDRIYKILFKNPLKALLDRINRINKIQLKSRRPAKNINGHLPPSYLPPRRGKGINRINKIQTTTSKKAV
jgi:hypothetical protein